TRLDDARIDPPSRTLRIVAARYRIAARRHDSHCARSPGRRMRPVRIAPIDALVTPGPGGTVYLKSTVALGEYPERITDALERWAESAGDRPFLAERRASGAWREITYGESLPRVRRIGQALLDRGLSQDRPLLILSGNGIDHALLALAAMHVGVVY